MIQNKKKTLPYLSFGDVDDTDTIGGELKIASFGI